MELVVWALGVIALYGLMVLVFGSSRPNDRDRGHGPGE